MKHKVVKKMTYLGFFGYCLIYLLRSIILFFYGVIAIIPFFNIPLLKLFLDNTSIDEIIDGEDSWEGCKSKFKIVKQTKIKVIEEILEKV